MFCFFTILFASFIILFKNPVYSILSLILTFVSVSFIFLILGLDFIAITFLIVYVGAIAVLFLFVVMMLNIKVIELEETFWRFIGIGVLVVLIFSAEVFSIIFNNFLSLTGLFSMIDWLSDSIFSISSVHVCAIHEDVFIPDSVISDFSNHFSPKNASLGFRLKMITYSLSKFGVTPVEYAKLTEYLVSDPKALEKALCDIGDFEYKIAAEINNRYPCSHIKGTIYQLLLAADPEFMSTVISVYMDHAAECNQVYGALLNKVDNSSIKFHMLTPSECDEIYNSIATPKISSIHEPLNGSFFLVFSKIGVLNEDRWLNCNIFHNTAQIGYMLYTYFFIIFMVVSLILLITMIGCIVLVLHQNINVKRQIIFNQVSKELANSISLKTISRGE